MRFTLSIGKYFYFYNFKIIEWRQNLPTNLFEKKEKLFFHASNKRKVLVQNTAAIVTFGNDNQVK